MRTLRIDHVVVATPDAEGAAATFRGHFELAPSAPAGRRLPALTIGDARIAFVTPAAALPSPPSSPSRGEGMAEVCLEVASLAEADAALREAGIGFAPKTEGRRTRDRDRPGSRAWRAPDAGRGVAIAERARTGSYTALDLWRRRLRTRIVNVK